jgi:hypothetical protein
VIRTFIEWAGLPKGSRDLLRGWSICPLYRNKELAGIAIVSGTEIHFACAPEQRHVLIQRTRAREFLRPLMERRGFLTTRVYHGDGADKRKRFIERLGFVHTHSETCWDHYMLSDLPFGKET